MEDISTNHHLLTLLTLLNYGGDCRTAPATPGLLNIFFNGVVGTYNNAHLETLREHNNDNIEEEGEIVQLSARG